MSIVSNAHELTFGEIWPPRFERFTLAAVRFPLSRDEFNRSPVAQLLSRDPLAHETGGAALNANAKNAATPRNAKATR
jgi:hypothetical protein